MDGDLPKVTLWAGGSARPPQPAVPTQRTPALEQLPSPGAGSPDILTRPLGWTQREQGLGWVQSALCPHVIRGIGAPTLIQEARPGPEQERTQRETQLLVPCWLAASQTWTWPLASSWALGAPCRPRAPGGTSSAGDPLSPAGPGKGSTQTGLRSQVCALPFRMHLNHPPHPRHLSPL